jgi:DNA-binding PadR family transcriptional regulator
MGPPPFGPPGRMGGRRARRGNIRAAVLALLVERPMHGYEIMQELERRTSGNWRPSPGSIYPTLQMLADEGLVSVEESDGRRLFSLTDAGRAESAGQGPHSPWEEMSSEGDPSLLKVRRALFQVIGATRQATAAGSEQQRNAVLEILSDARRRIYSILAEGD